MDSLSFLSLDWRLQPVEFGPSVVKDGDGGAEGADAGEV